MKPLQRKNYGSIPHLSSSKLGENDSYIHPGQERILTVKKRDRHDTILVFEKYDGSNVGVAKKDGKIYALTRAGYEAHTSEFYHHQAFSKWVQLCEGVFQSILKEGERVVGEWLLQAHGMRYSIRGHPIVFFDYFSSDNERYPFAELKKTGLRTPRLLHGGNAISVEKLLPMLNRKTKWLKSHEDPEGMVYRVERKGAVDFLAKWVRPGFTPGKYIINKTQKDLFANELVGTYQMNVEFLKFYQKNTVS